MDWCYPNANYFRNCFATHWLPDVIITDNRWCGLNCMKNKKWLPCGFFIRSKSYTFLQPLGCYSKTEHTIQFLFGHFVSFQEQYMMTSDSMIIQTSTFWKTDMVIHKPKDYSVLIIVYLLHCFWVRGCGMKNDDVITQVHQKWSYPKCGKLYINRKVFMNWSFFY